VQPDRGWIEAHIPHKGSMCLLDEVLSWDSARIRCRSSTHRSPANPLRAHGRLGAICGLEYAAQAMAVHGALLAAHAGQRAATRGYIASVRDIALHVSRLDDLASDLIAEAAQMLGNERTALYELSVCSAGRVLVTGRATVVFEGLQGTRPSQEASR
jgi:predicted hotdog family 3-hydroxylacyl-ACP dehydratase